MFCCAHKPPLLRVSGAERKGLLWIKSKKGNQEADPALSNASIENQEDFQGGDK